MAHVLLRQLTTRFSFTILTGAVVLCGCRATSGRTSEIQSNTSESSPVVLGTVPDFLEVVESEFNTMREDSEAEFLGCLCVNDKTDQSKWVAWQFLNVGSKGYRTPTDKKIYDDLEACVAMRETLMECEG